MTVIYNDFLNQLLSLQQDGKHAISAPTNWMRQEPLLEVNTKIDEIIKLLCNTILQNERKNTIARWHFFIGSPGNGKSAAIGKLCRDLKSRSCLIRDENGTPIEDLAPGMVPYAIRIYERGNSFASAMVIQDASVVRNPFAPDVDPANELLATLEDAWEKGISLVVCTNRGVLEKAYREHYRESTLNRNLWFKVIKGIVEKGNETTEGELEGDWIFNDRKHAVFSKFKVSFCFLENQSLLLGSDVFDRLVQKATCEAYWNTCGGCPDSSLCPFKANRDWLANENARVKFLHVLRRAEVLSGQTIVFREALALLSLLLAGCPRDYGNKHPCQWVQEKARANDIFALATRRIYMCLFSSFSPYGLEFEPEFRERQREALSLLHKLTGESNNDLKKILEPVLNGTNTPSTDVGVRRLTRPDGLLAELDPWCDSLPQEFLETWDDNLGETAKCTHPLFTEIEKRCTQAWSRLEELIESTPSHKAPTCYWALKRWSSNFLLHFGGLLEGLTCWGKELDEFIKILETIVKDPAQRTAEEKRNIKELNNQMAALLAAGGNEYTGKVAVVPLSENVRLAGRWVSDKLRPHIDTSKRPGSLFMVLRYLVWVTA